MYAKNFTHHKYTLFFQEVKGYLLDNPFLLAKEDIMKENISWINPSWEGESPPLACPYGDILIHSDTTEQDLKEFIIWCENLLEKGVYADKVPLVDKERGYLSRLLAVTKNFYLHNLPITKENPCFCPAVETLCPGGAFQRGHCWILEDIEKEQKNQDN